MDPLRLTVWDKRFPKINTSTSQKSEERQGICIIDDGTSRRRTRNARFQTRRADHSTTSMCNCGTLVGTFTLVVA